MKALDSHDPATVDIIAEVLNRYHDLGLLIMPQAQAMERLLRIGVLHYQDDGSPVFADPDTICVVDEDDDGLPIVGPRATVADLVEMAESVLSDAEHTPELAIAKVLFAEYRTHKDDDDEWQHFADMFGNEPVSARQEEFADVSVALTADDRAVVLEQGCSGGLAAVTFHGDDHATVVAEGQTYSLQRRQPRTLALVRSKDQ